ncbi:hypothetical protein CC86DRAFT_370890 [Ophiobolus disseminans]|uniref:Uncharacterized protein n=1 Tax=Ophiobolus disseminans TaxID=1469910 RepID=A0A6A6ZX23_9PLEO|nr:hypothetical protein CC86DRAFT_370890 [Ophiobolus disseminans]
MPASNQPTQQQPSPFFALPLELRETIYHHVFLTHRFIQHPFPPQPPSSTPIPTYPIPNTMRDMHLRYRLPDTTSPAYSTFSDYATDQSWLLTSKTVMLEALAQFVRNAEWSATALHILVHEDTTRVKYRPKRHWTTRLPIDATLISCMDLYVENLAYWESPAVLWGTDSRADVAILARALRESKIELSRLRCVGHSYDFHGGSGMGEVCRGQTGNMFRNLRLAFADVHISSREFGIINMPRTNLWVLFKWVEGKGKLVTYKRRLRVKAPDPPPERDLANLLPEGWVLKREVCGREECDGCYPAERETWRDVEMGG